jgi:hypothetical protein
MELKTFSSSNAKVRKGEKKGYLTGILHLAPWKLSGFQVCSMASINCIEVCLNTAGRGRFTKIQEIRIEKTRWYFKNRVSFMRQAIKDCRALERKCQRENKTPCVRLNGTSDIMWENVPITGQMIDGEGREIRYRNLMEMFPAITFYDYTKHMAHRRRNLPPNYSLTFSLSEKPESEEQAVEAMAAGWNVAVVFHKVPQTFTIKGIEYPVFNGDVDDLRFLDPKGVIIGLTPKGKAKTDKSGFVR